jgi:hypothetical protein
MRRALFAGLLVGCAFAPLACRQQAALPPAPPQAEQPQEAPVEKPGPAEQPEEGWADATKESAIIGDLEVRVIKARVGKPRVIHAFTEGEFPMPDDYLIIYLRLKNRSQTEKVRHDGWTMTKYQRWPKLTDDHGKSNRHYSSIAAYVDGVRVWVGSLDPGKEADDIVLFPVPAANATRLKLELPAQPNSANFDPRARPIDPGTIRFIIPMNMVKRGD